MVSTLVIALCVSSAFQPVPSKMAGAQPTGLEARVVSYNGNTNGLLTLEVRNISTELKEFSAAGLFFVPAVDPDRAPQRLGAVGSYQVDAVRHERLKIPAGATVLANLDVYCIDSHRPSPTSKTPFRLAKSRLPAQLSRTIEAESEVLAAPHGGTGNPQAKSVIQGTVWKNRDAKWVPLEGESKQEAGK